MKLSRQTKFFLWSLAAVTVALASFFAGSALKPDEEPYYIFQTDAPAYAEPSGVAATSPGGFTGFGETDGSNSRVVLGGRVVEKDGDSITLEGTQGQRASLRFGESPRILRLDTGSASLLRPGVSVAVRLNEAGDTVEAVLVLSQP
jgi:hypothetical protein